MDTLVHPSLHTLWENVLCLSFNIQRENVCEDIWLVYYSLRERNRKQTTAYGYFIVRVQWKMWWIGGWHTGGEWWSSHVLVMLYRHDYGHYERIMSCAMRVMFKKRAYVYHRCPFKHQMNKFIVWLKQEIIDELRAGINCAHERGRWEYQSKNRQKRRNSHINTLHFMYQSEKLLI